MFWKKCGSEIWEVKKNHRLGKKEPATQLGEWVGNIVRSTLPELPNTSSMVVIRWVLNHNDVVLVSNQLDALNTNVIYQEQLIHFINRNRGPEETLTLTLKFT